MAYSSNSPNKMLPSSRSSPGSATELFQSLPAKAVLVVVYISLNMSLNILNKWLLSKYGFPFPLLLSIAHMVFSFIVLFPFMLMKHFREQHSATLQKQWLGLLAVGSFFAINIAFNNISLLSISLSLNQVIRASIPVCTALGAIVIEHKVPTRQEFFALLLLVGGVGISVYEGSGTKSSFYGTMLCIIGTVCNGLMLSSIGKLLTEKMDVWRLTFYTAPITTFVLVPFYIKLEAEKFKKYHAANSESTYLILLLLGCLNALLYNIVHSLVIKVTSSVTTTVLGEMKIVLILLLSAMVLGESDIWTARMLIGCTTAILGFCLYSHSRMLASSSQFQPIIKGIPELSPNLSDSIRAPLLSTQSYRG